MVSTRGLKFKFSEGEKVLCYEPDPSKARVLYDSKVLKIIVKKDKRGRKAVEYLIHFQGWNASWDRYVSEDYILKHTEENWKLQRELAEKAQLRRGAYLYRRDHKDVKQQKSPNKNKSTLDRKNVQRHCGRETQEDNPDDSSCDCGNATDDSHKKKDSCCAEREKYRRYRDVMEGNSVSEDYETVDSESEQRSAQSDDENFSDTTDDSETYRNIRVSVNEDRDEEEEEEDNDGNLDGTQSEAGSSEHVEEDNFLLEISDVMKDILELDNELVTNMNKVVILPATPNVVNILEDYVRQYAVKQVYGTPETPRRRYRRRHNKQSKSPDAERIRGSINICKEVADGVRIYFDFTLGGLLLYNKEREQYDHSKDIVIKEEIVERPFPAIKQEDENKVLPSGLSQYSTKVNTSQTSMISDLNSGGANMSRRSRSQHHSNIDTKDCVPSRYTSDGKEEEKSDITNHEHTASKGNFSVSVAAKEESVPITSNKLPSASGSSTKSTIPTVPVSEESFFNRGCPSTASSIILSEVLSWKLVPDHVHTQKPVPPSLIYGAIHLARLFVKLPELLQATNMPTWKLKLVLRHLQMILKYLEEHQDWFGQQFYQENTFLKNE